MKCYTCKGALQEGGACFGYRSIRKTAIKPFEGKEPFKGKEKEIYHALN
jgi:hypothetical protein